MKFCTNRFIRVCHTTLFFISTLVGSVARSFKAGKTNFFLACLLKSLLWRELFKLRAFGFIMEICTNCAFIPLRPCLSLLFSRASRCLWLSVSFLGDLSFRHTWCCFGRCGCCGCCNHRLFSARSMCIRNRNWIYQFLFPDSFVHNIHKLFKCRFFDRTLLKKCPPNRGRVFS